MYIYPLTLDSSSHWKMVSERVNGTRTTKSDRRPVTFFAANLLQMQTHHSDNDSHTHSSIIEPSEVLWAPPGCVVLCCAVSNCFWFQNCCCCWGTQEKEYEHGKALLLAGLANYCSTHPLCMLYFLLLFFLILHLPTFFFFGLTVMCRKARNPRCGRAAWWLSVWPWLVGPVQPIYM